MVSDNYNRLKTACKYEEVDYVIRFRGMIDDEVKAHIMSLLVPGLGTYVSITPIRPRALAPVSVFTPRGVRFFDFDSARGQQYTDPNDPFVGWAERRNPKKLYAVDVAEMRCVCCYPILVVCLRAISFGRGERWNGGAG